MVTKGPGVHSYSLTRVVSEAAIHSSYLPQLIKYTQLTIPRCKGVWEMSLFPAFMCLPAILRDKLGNTCWALLAVSLQLWGGQSGVRTPLNSGVRTRQQHGGSPEGYTARADSSRPAGKGGGETKDTGLGVG